jgi:hypothetical protein
MDLRELHAEKQVLEDMILRMSLAMTRGCNWLISQFAPNGPILSGRDVSYHHKVTWGLFEDARLAEVEQLLDWLVANARQGPAEYFFPEEPPFNKEMQLLYRFLTFAKVAERLRHPAFACDEVRDRVLRYQHASGGAFVNLDSPQYRQTCNPLITSFFTEWALPAGLMEPAQRSGDFLAMVVELNEQHMNAEPGRFYFNWDTTKEALVTEPEPGGNLNCFVDTVGSQQHFYFIGCSMAALADLYLATGIERYRDACENLAAFELRLNPRGLYWPSYCKVGWGSAEYYRITGDPRERRAAANVSLVTFMGAQTKAGGWENMYYPLRDEGVAQQVVYDGRGLVPEGAVGQGLEDDGSWAWLSGHELSGEFLGEMGCTLKAFQEGVNRVDRRIEALSKRGCCCCEK